MHEPYQCILQRNKKDFEYIAIDVFGNEDFKSATKYFYSEEAQTKKGNYRHYVDGVETIW